MVHIQVWRRCLPNTPPAVMTAGSSPRHHDTSTSRLHDERLKRRNYNKNSQRNSKEEVFNEGDYVLRARILSKVGDKMTARWEGPYMIEEAITPWVYKIGSLKKDSHDTFIVHASRLKFYSDNSLKITEQIIDFASAGKFELDKVSDIRQKSSCNICGLVGI